MTKDLYTGVIPSSVSRSDTSFLHTDNLYNAHSNIPPPHDEGAVFVTFTSWPPVLESTNQYDVLRDNELMPIDTGAAVPRFVQLAKRPASSLSQVKVVGGMAPTTVLPTLTVMHQSSNSSGARAVMNAWLGGAERVPSTDSDKATSHNGKVCPWGPSHAVGLEANTMAWPPLVTEQNARMLKFKSPGWQGALMKNQPSTEPVVQGKDRADTPQTTSHAAGAKRWVPSDPAGMEEKGEAVSSSAMTLTQPVVPERLFTVGDDTYKSRVCQTTTPLEHHSETHKTRTVGCAMAPTKTATGQEAAGAQAVKRGHSVTMIEVPDEEDDTAYQQWLANRSPIASLKQCKTALLTPPDSPATKAKTLPNKRVEVTSPTVAMPSMASAKAQEVPHRWMKPFEIDWTLWAIQEACNGNAAHTALCVWIHKDQLGELTDELLDELRGDGETALERLYKLCELLRYIRRRKDSANNFMLKVRLSPCTGTQALTTKALIDSGCTGSTINHTYVQKHQLETWQMTVPIPVYNADGTRNRGWRYHGNCWIPYDYRRTQQAHQPHCHLPRQERCIPWTWLAQAP